MPISDVDALEASDNTTGPWTIVGKKASYEVTRSATVTKINGLSISSTLGIKEGKTVALTVTKSGSAADKAVTWSKSGNVTFVTSLTDATPVASPTGETVYVKLEKPLLFNFPTNGQGFLKIFKKTAHSP